MADEKPRPAGRRKPRAKAAAPGAAKPRRARKARTDRVDGAPTSAIASATPPATGLAGGDLPDQRGGVYEFLWSTGLLKVGAVARRELGAYFVSPVGYVIGALLIPLVSYFAFLPPLSSGAPVGMDPVFSGLVYLMVFVVPLFTMRLLAEERRTGTMELLLTSPVRDWELVLGKWLGALLFFIAITAFVAVFAAILVYFQPTHQVLTLAGLPVSIGNLDLGATFSGYLGMLLVASMLLAVGLLCSSLTQNQIVAAFAGVVVMVSLVYLLQFGSFLRPPLSDISQYLGAYNHFTSFNQGRIVLRDLIYFLTVTVAALFLTTRVLESRRWR